MGCLYYIKEYHKVEVNVELALERVGEWGLHEGVQDNIDEDEDYHWDDFDCDGLRGGHGVHEVGGGCWDRWRLLVENILKGGGLWMKWFI